MNCTLEEILDVIGKFETIIIHRHKNPDGDAIGSQIGLKAILQKAFPQKRIFVVGDSGERFSFLKDSSMDEISDSEYENALAIILDTAAEHLLCNTKPLMAKFVIRLDHHIYCGPMGDLEYIDTKSESCAGIVTDFAMVNKLEVPIIGAMALYTGIVTDSGRFRYDSTSSKTFERVSFLLKNNIDTSYIYSNLYSESYDKVKLRASFVLKIRFTKNNVAYIYTTQKELDDLKEEPFTISRGMVNVMGDIKGVDIWVNFTESNGSVMVELRSSKYNINPIAVKYGGGGHAKACGASLKNYEEAMAMLKDLDEMVEGK
ncbi:MAG: bifunctional oligoribonuclease/PAP phosphatase NrnA [Sphaerochaetaceae bacterium]|nr:bifunctional oligoribonuclease/PAP phosphatase NrnA [Sphaerochaetaceae bacterium]